MKFLSLEKTSKILCAKFKEMFVPNTPSNSGKISLGTTSFSARFMNLKFEILNKGSLQIFVIYPFFA